MHHNTIVHRRGHGRNGVVTDTGDERFWRDANNSFDRNIYIVADESSDHWTFNNMRHAWHGVRGLGHEQNGELIVERPAKTELSCDR